MFGFTSHFFVVASEIPTSVIPDCNWYTTFPTSEEIICLFTPPLRYNYSFCLFEGKTIANAAIVSPKSSLKSHVITKKNICSESVAPAPDPLTDVLLRHNRTPYKLMWTHGVRQALRLQLFYNFYTFCNVFFASQLFLALNLWSERPQKAVPPFDNR